MHDVSCVCVYVSVYVCVLLLQYLLFLSEGVYSILGEPLLSACWHFNPMLMQINRILNDLYTELKT